MSRARDTFRYQQSSDAGKDDEHAIERDNTTMFVVLLIAAVGVVLSFVFWAF